MKSGSEPDFQDLGSKNRAARQRVAFKELRYATVTYTRVDVAHALAPRSPPAITKPVGITSVPCTPEYTRNAPASRFLRASEPASDDSARGDAAFDPEQLAGFSEVRTNCRRCQRSRGERFVNQDRRIIHDPNPDFLRPRVERLAATCGENSKFRLFV